VYGGLGRYLAEGEVGLAAASSRPARSPKAIDLPAHAKLLFSEPPKPIDRRACEAAQQGLEALNRFV